MFLTITKNYSIMNKSLKTLTAALLLALPCAVYAQPDSNDIPEITNSSDSVETFTVNGVSFRMIRVDAGTFTMGEPGFIKYSPFHEVTLSTYYIGETEVTQQLWYAVLESNPSYFKDPQKPVERVTWDDCQHFIRILNILTGRQFRLPTEAEWEFAARGGNKSKGYKYAGNNNVYSVGWTEDYTTHPVAQKKPNELGIYDMSGNVSEWCQDWSGPFSKKPQTNPTGPSTGSGRIFRGGSWYDDYKFCQVSYRLAREPENSRYTVGFRLAL